MHGLPAPNSRLQLAACTQGHGVGAKLWVYKTYWVTDTLISCHSDHLGRRWCIWICSVDEIGCYLSCLCTSCFQSSKCVLKRSRQVTSGSVVSLSSVSLAPEYGFGGIFLERLASNMAHVAHARTPPVCFGVDITRSVLRRSVTLCHPAAKPQW